MVMFSNWCPDLWYLDWEPIDSEGAFLMFQGE